MYRAWINHAKTDGEPRTSWFCSRLIGWRLHHRAAKYNFTPAIPKTVNLIPSVIRADSHHSRMWSFVFYFKSIYYIPHSCGGRLHLVSFSMQQENGLVKTEQQHHLLKTMTHVQFIASTLPVSGPNAKFVLKRAATCVVWGIPRVLQVIWTLFFFKNDDKGRYLMCSTWRNVSMSCFPVIQL